MQKFILRRTRIVHERIELETENFDKAVAHLMDLNFQMEEKKVEVDKFLSSVEYIGDVK